jgi:hypothetical protein
MPAAFMKFDRIAGEMPFKHADSEVVKEFAELSHLYFDDPVGRLDEVLQTKLPELWGWVQSHLP